VQRNFSTACKIVNTTARFLACAATVLAVPIPPCSGGSRRTEHLPAVLMQAAESIAYAGPDSQA